MANRFNAQIERFRNIAILPYFYFKPRLIFVDVIVGVRTKNNIQILLNFFIIFISLME